MNRNEMSELEDAIKNSSGIEKVRLILRKVCSVFIEDSLKHDNTFSELVDCIIKAYVLICDSFYVMGLYGEENPVFKNKEIVDLFTGLDKEKKRSIIIGSRIWGVAIGVVISKSAREEKVTIDFSAVCSYLYNSSYNDDYKNEIIENVIRTINLLKTADEGYELSKQANDPTLETSGIMSSKDLHKIYLSFVDGDQTFVERGNYVHPSFALACWMAIAMSYARLDVSRASKEVINRLFIR